MTKIVEIRVPDIGDFKNVDVIEVLVKPDDRVVKEQSLITLESDKATTEVPSPYDGVVQELRINVGDKASQDTPILTLAVEAPEVQKASAPPPMQPRPSPPAPRAEGELHADVVVLGSGPGGYTAAFRAADLGKNVILVERYDALGGVCLNVGCIPSKALLHVAQVIDDAAVMGDWGVTFKRAEIDAPKLVQWWKNKVVRRLTDGVAGLASRRKVTVVHGVGTFTSPNTITVKGAQGETSIAFDNAIIASGSRAVKLPDFPNDDPRLLDSTAALNLPAIGGELLVIGGGVIGLEMATFYHAFGTRVTIVELSGNLMPGVDADLVKPLQKRIQSRYEAIHLNTRVSRIEPRDDGLWAWFEGNNAPESQRFDHVLVAVGRRPNSNGVGLENTGVRVNQAGFIDTDIQQRTNVPHIFAIGDVTGPPLLAHRASHQGKVAAEVIAGEKAAFDVRAIPSVAYTDPEIAWAGITETEAKTQGIDYGKGSFPWAASGRSLSLGRDEGMTKMLFDKNSGRVIGVGIVGPYAGELIAEGVLAIEMGADAADIALTVHPHPTLSETLGFSAEAFEGTITDLYLRGRR